MRLELTDKTRFTHVKEGEAETRERVNIGPRFSGFPTAVTSLRRFCIKPATLRRSRIILSYNPYIRRLSILGLLFPTQAVQAGVLKSEILRLVNRLCPPGWIMRELKELTRRS